MPKRVSRTTTSAPKPPGAFLADGSWSEKAELRHRGHIHGLVKALVAKRREGSLTPAIAASFIEAANATLAFPSYRQWATNPHWGMAITMTDVEESVKREGRGSQGHWCGERWLAGTEHDCPETRHRIHVSIPAGALESLAALSRLLPPARDADGDEIPPAEVANG